jgi:phosphatidate cytidylyltransferase
MFRTRLLFGTMMVLFFGGVLLVDGWLDGSINPGIPIHSLAVQGTLLTVLVMLLVATGEMELERLLASTGTRVFRPVVIPFAVLLSIAWYMKQLFPGMDLGHYFAYVSAFALMAVFLFQARKHLTRNVIENCGGNLFAIFYLGLLGSFAVGVRTEFGVWPMLMFIFTVKSCDIGAYVAGRLFGKHKFSPNISPAKTWEGMAGGVILSMVVGAFFAAKTGIMGTGTGAVFGLIFAFIGQLGDLAESMIKRDARLKDSSHSVPGFGGVLDVIDSPLMAAPFAMIFFSCFIIRQG